MKMSRWRNLLDGLRLQFAEGSVAPETRSALHDEVAAAPAAINLGIDFGTSFTKVCFRDAGTDDSGVVFFGESNRTSIIPSVVFIDPDGSLFLPHHREARASCCEVRYLKMGLAGLPIEAPPAFFGMSEGRENLTRALSAWFLAHVLKELEIYVKTSEARRLRNRRIIWSANIGVPVAHYDFPALGVFQEVLGVAWRWNIAGSIPANRHSLLATYERDRGDLKEEETDFHAVPEIAAAVHSFVMSRSATPGIYVYFDVGGGTVDGVAFNFRTEGGVKRVDFYSGKVAPIGLEVLKSRGEQLPTGKKAAKSPLQTELQQLVAQVVFGAKKIDGRDWRQGKIQCGSAFRSRIGRIAERDMAPLVIFTGGYGGDDPWYRTHIKATYNDFGHGNAGIPPYQLVEVPTPSDLALSGGDKFSRFAVAYGLSVPFGEGPKFQLPSKFDPVERPMRQRESLRRRLC